MRRLEPIKQTKSQSVNVKDQSKKGKQGGEKQLVRSRLEEERLYIKF